jgi:hypothetical protein
MADWLSGWQGVAAIAIADAMNSEDPKGQIIELILTQVGGGGGGGGSGVLVMAGANNSRHHHHRPSSLGGGGGGSALQHQPSSKLSQASSEGALPPGWNQLQHSVSGQPYFYNEINHETMWNRPQLERDPPELYKLRPEHRSLLGEQPSDQLESLPSIEGSIKPDDIKRALETVSMSELELKTKLRTIGPGLYLAKVIFESSVKWFRRWHTFAVDRRVAREEKYERDVTQCQAVCRGWLERGRAERLRILLWRQSRMTCRAIRKELAQFLGDQARAERSWQKGEFRDWFEDWRDTQYKVGAWGHQYESMIGYRRKDRKKRLAKEQWDIVEKKREEAERLRKIEEAAAIEARF